MPCISKEKLASPLHLKQERFPLPEYGEDAYICIRELTSHELLALDKTKEGQTALHFLCSILAVVLVDDEGKALFVSAEEAQAGLNLSMSRLEEMADKALTLSGMKGEAKN